MSRVVNWPWVLAVLKLSPVQAFVPSVHHGVAEVVDVRFGNFYNRKLTVFVQKVDKLVDKL